MALFKGFDTSQYPGDSEMAALKPYFDFVCFYLPSPSHHDDSWMEKRSFLEGLGYGLIPLYVGQQIIGPGSHVVTAEQGTIDGDDAVNVMRRAGFTLNSRVFNDLENGAPMTAEQQAYCGAMNQEVSNVRFAKFGLYASHSFASVAAASSPGAAIWTFKIPTTTTTYTDLDSIDFPEDIAESGYSEAMIWQFRQNVSIQVPGFENLLVDLNVSTVQNPSVSQ